MPTNPEEIRRDALEKLSAFLEIPVERLEYKIDDRPLLNVFPRDTVIQEGKSNNLWIREDHGWSEANASYDPDWAPDDTADDLISNWFIVSIPVHWIDTYLELYQKWGKKEQ